MHIRWWLSDVDHDEGRYLFFDKDHGRSEDGAGTPLRAKRCRKEAAGWVC